MRNRSVFEGFGAERKVDACGEQARNQTEHHCDVHGALQQHDDMDARKAEEWYRRSKGFKHLFALWATWLRWTQRGF